MKDIYKLKTSPICKEGSIIKDLIDMAGGVTEEADLSCINRAEELVNHELIIIGNINDETESSVVQNSSVSSGNSTDNDSKSSTLININTADLEQLKKITGIGDIKAQSIIDYREANGGFKSLEELKNVKDDERKANFIHQITSGAKDLRSVDDLGSESISYAEAKAAASGNPLLLEHCSLVSKYNE